MTNRLELSWKLDGFVDEQRYYRSLSSVNIVSPPRPNAILPGDARTHIDADINVNETYYVRFSSVKGSREKFSNEIIISTQIEFNPLWSNVRALILADSPSFPSTAIVDKASTASISTINRPTQVANAAFQTGGAFLINTNNMVLQISNSSYAFGLADFVVECEVLVSEAFIAATYAQSIINIGSVYGETGRSIGLSLSSGELRVNTRPAGSSSYATEYPTGVTITHNVKYHLAIMRKSGVFYFFLNGEVIYTLSETINLSLNVIRFMQYGGVNNRYLNSVRVSLGAFYPETGFTPPTHYPAS